MAKKDGFESFLELLGAVITSKGKDGKPDLYAAAGIAAGLGHTSFEDTMALGAVLGAQGAFDEETPGTHDPSFSNAMDDEEFQDTEIGGITVKASDMRKLSEAGYCESDLGFESHSSLLDLMERIGIDTTPYDFEDTVIAGITVYAEDMRLLDECGYDLYQLEDMSIAELREAMDMCCVDIEQYDFDCL